MPNMSDRTTGKEERRFIEDVARLLLPWGVPPAAARLYGYLLLCPHPVSRPDHRRSWGQQKQCKRGREVVGELHAGTPTSRARDEAGALRRERRLQGDDPRA